MYICAAETGKMETAKKQKISDTDSLAGASAPVYTLCEVIHKAGKVQHDLPAPGSILVPHARGCSVPGFRRSGPQMNLILPTDDYTAHMIQQGGEAVRKLSAYFRPSCSTE